jgi:L-threonylcarbamoyladenylate synthase
MERIDALDPSAVSRAAQVLASGGIILYPTDTLYGLGADALSDDAVDKIYMIKARDPGKPIHCIVADIPTAEGYGEVSDTARLLAQHFLPGALTLILKKHIGIESGITRGMETIGVRIPKNDFCHSLALEFARPYTTTSANLAGLKTERSVDMILAQLGIQADLIGLIIDGGELPEQLPSTIVDLSIEEPVILREGAISASDITSKLRF